MIKIRPTIHALQLNAGERFAQGIFMPYSITNDDEADGVIN